jgi:hypothetical protein
VILILGSASFALGAPSAAAQGKQDPLTQCFGPGPLTPEEAQMQCVKVGDGEWEPSGGVDLTGGTDFLGGFMVLGLFLSLIPAFVGYAVAESQNLEGWIGVLAGLFFSWLGVIGVYLYGRSQNATATPSREPEPSDRLKRLQDLLGQGLITQQEYDERRAATLDSL